MTISAYERHIKAERQACKRNGLSLQSPIEDGEWCETCRHESDECLCPETYREALELADLASEFINPLTKSEADYDPFAA